MKDEMMPAENVRPSRRTRRGSSCACSRKLKILIAITGNTHGMKFKMKPPIKAATMQLNRLCVDSPLAKLNFSSRILGAVAVALAPFTAGDDGTAVGAADVNGSVTG